MMGQHVALVFGTRPEAIKLFPVIYALRERTSLRISVLVTGQHRAMLDQVLAVADIRPDVDLDIMVPNQSLDGLTARLLLGIGEAFDADRPDFVIVQGDTTSAMVASLAAFYRKIPVAHVEAGLRTGNNYSPWPEEINRRIISPIASLHFAPTRSAAANLARENVDPVGIHITGNTGIDALLLTSSTSGPFNWAAKADARLVSGSASKTKEVVAEHDGYLGQFGVRHRRSVSMSDEGRVTIADELIGGSDPLPVQISFLINPHLSVRTNDSRRNSILVEDAGRPIAEFSYDGALEPHVAFGDGNTGNGWVSPSFGRLNAAYQILFEGLLSKTSIVEIAPLG
jgi:UDP-N-acetylglucosamine 2-epimerase/Heparinase II/III-like protein